MYGWAASPQRRTVDEVIAWIDAQSRGPLDLGLCPARDRIVWNFWRLSFGYLRLFYLTKV